MDNASLLAGFAHPIGGADHFLVMVAIGIWGALAGGRALWAWPLAFVSTTLVGFTVAMWGLQVPLVEPAIAASIVVLGLLIAFAVRAPVWLGAVIAGLFAFFHGHAHGTEALAAGVAPIAYATGFSLATAALHALGIGAGLLIARSAGASLSRAAGGLIAISGLSLLSSLA
ncbi:MAG TPA: HupE/UreJ family protein [Steroidobacteraceae bacterium]|jgi:urease accessory protein|nr:HupE/UreJ family protein [Steroidobacteraceae bacterium]